LSRKRATTLPRVTVEAAVVVMTAVMATDVVDVASPPRRPDH
jgi:hypothetical protein